MTAPPVVLLVDDESDLRETLALALEHESFRVLEAANGREALALLEASEELPDVVVLDLMMPVMNGVAFLEACRTRPRLAGLPIVVLSAATQYIPTPGARLAFRKPVSLDALSRGLRAVCAEGSPRARAVE